MLLSSVICSDFGIQENKVCHCFHCFPIYLPWRMPLCAMILVFWMSSFKLAFSLSSFTFIKRLFSFSLLSAIRVVSSAYLRLLIFILAFLILACSFIQPGISHEDTVYPALFSSSAVSDGIQRLHWVSVSGSPQEIGWEGSQLGTWVIFHLTCVNQSCSHLIGFASCYFFSPNVLLATEWISCVLFQGQKIVKTSVPFFL